MTLFERGGSIGALWHARGTNGDAAGARSSNSMINGTTGDTGGGTRLLDPRAQKRAQTPLGQAGGGYAFSTATTSHVERQTLPVGWRQRYSICRVRSRARASPWEKLPSLAGGMDEFRANSPELNELE
ncbi:unnamed protein product [Heligmosomoides polygyrus]|uniref:Uncharacterized protein n=1 Tax=Heligmosomoides polygyrus TaxID=6339 RepID=A0A183FSG6_HELPZ|nr:unnamed protein product [Heligmosomoides polygyrus]